MYRITKLLLPLLIICLIPQMTLAGKKKKKDLAFEEPTMTDWNVKVDSALKIFDAAMIFEKVVSDDEKVVDKGSFRTIYRRIRILSAAGREWGDVDAPVLSKGQKIKKIMGRTLLPDGKIIELTEDQIFEKEVVKTKGDKFKQTTFSMPGLTDDCIIEYIIKIHTDGYLSEWVAQKDIPVLRAEMHWYLAQLDISKAVAKRAEDRITPNYLWLNTSSKVNVTQLPNIKAPTSLLFESGYIPPFEEEPRSVPDASLKTKLYTYYGSAAPVETYWGEKSRDELHDMEDFCEKNKRVKKIVEPFKELATDEEKIQAALDWIHANIINISYLDDEDKIEVGKRNSDKKKLVKKKKLNKNKNASDVIKNGYAWRTHICNTFCDMLREMNIDAKLAWTKDRSEDLFVKKAKFWQFDCVMVAVPDGSDQFKFYAPGYACTTPGMVPWYTEGVVALICGAEDYLSIVPFSSATSNGETHAFTYTLGEDFIPKGEVHLQYSGQKARSLRLDVFNEDSTDFQQLLLDEIKDEFSKAELDSLQFENIDDATEPLGLSCSVKYPALLTQAGRVLFKPFDYCRETENPFHANDRQYGILFKYAHQIRESAQFEIPDGWIVEGLPEPRTFESAVGKCTISIANFGNQLSVQRLFCLNSPFWVAENYSFVKELYQNLQDMSSVIVVLAQQPQEQTSP